jgi:hypothetical protein
MAEMFWDVTGARNPEPAHGGGSLSLHYAENVTRSAGRGINVRLFATAVTRMQERGELWTERYAHLVCRSQVIVQQHLESRIWGGSKMGKRSCQIVISRRCGPDTNTSLVSVTYSTQYRYI